MAWSFGFTHERDATTDTASIRIRFSGSPSIQDLAGWSDVLRTFINGARCGAMSGASILPSGSGCVVREFFLDSCEARVYLSNVALDSGAAIILCNMCQWGHVHIAKVDNITLHWPAISHSPEALPRRWPQLSFELHEYDLVGQTIVVDIEFVDPQSADMREIINHLIGQWFKVANWGGYASGQYSPSQSTILISSIPITTEPHSINWHFDDYLCADSVFDGLLNCLENVHQTYAAIRRVTIGE